MILQPAMIECHHHRESFREELPKSGALVDGDMQGTIQSELNLFRVQATRPGRCIRRAFYLLNSGK